MLLGYIEYYVPGRPAPVETTAQPAAQTTADAASPRPAETVEKPKNFGQQIVELFRGVAVDPRFAAADTDRDGRMTLEEAKQAFSNVPRYRNDPALLERHFRFLDKDGNGTVTGQEFTRVSELGSR
jgi:Ca2+-binding EF-hand superfamily protein